MKAEIRTQSDHAMTSAPNILRAVKSLHTLIWAFFVGCILAVPIATRMGRFDCAGWASGLVLIEILVLVMNKWRCPLTDVASRYTDDRSDNFDIYLPAWIARYNKTIFGFLFFAGELYFLALWLG